MPLSKEKKDLYFKKMETLLESYNKVFIVKVDNVGSQQLNMTRLQMRGTAEILMGKNTLMRKVFKNYLEDKEGHPLHNLEPKCAGNVGFVFTNDDLKKVRGLILANRVPAPARIGVSAPLAVTIPAGPTGCDPGQTSFFQVLQIPTKIVKGQIEITNNVDLIKAGDKVGAAEASLLKKLNIRPFSYGLIIDSIYDNGTVFGPEVLDIDDAVLCAKLSNALKNIAAVSMEIGYPTQASMAHSVGKAFRCCVAVAAETAVRFDAAGPYLAYLADPSAFAGSAPAGGGSAAAAAPVVVAKEEEVDALEGGMDMFGGGGSDY